MAACEVVGRGFKSLWARDVDDASETGDTFGHSLFSGDFNGDNRDDLAIGVPFEDVNAGTGTMTDAGAVNVLYGSSNGLSATSPRADQFWTQASTEVDDPLEAGDFFGYNVG
jgi:FG-GAP repeat protein